MFNSAVSIFAGTSPTIIEGGRDDRQPGLAGLLPRRSPASPAGHRLLPAGADGQGAAPGPSRCTSPTRHPTSPCTKPVGASSQPSGTRTVEQETEKEKAAEKEPDAHRPERPTRRSAAAVLGVRPV
ncbi:hypothetical protein HBB16_07360 [Pseudonocardia sp. MCCB 268]|nr:hypothetical protein [Pseudonocardia cytotoxica]